MVDLHYILRVLLNINILATGLMRKFTFKYHIDNLVYLVCIDNIGFFYRNKFSFPIFSRKRIVEAVFLSVWILGRSFIEMILPLKPIDTVYHSALKCITSRYSLHTILYDKVGWSSLAERYKQHCYLFIYKVLVGKLPPYISMMLDWKFGPYLTRSNDLMMLKVGDGLNLESQPYLF